MLFGNGCRDRLELEEQGYVSAVGIDKGKNNNLSLTYQITNARYGSGGKASSGGDEIKNETITFESPDLVAAMNLANISVARRISLSHARILVIGEAYARDPEFFNQLEAAIREKEFRRGMNILVSREKASDFLHMNNPKLEARTSKYFDFMYDRWQDTGIVPESDLNKFLQRTEGDKSLYLAVYVSAKKIEPKDSGNEADYLPGEVDVEGGNPTQVVGAAVFKKGKMIGALTGDENRTNGLLRPTLGARSMLYAFKDPLDDKYKISARVLNSKANKFKFDLSNKYPIADVQIPIEVEILAIPSFEKYVEDPKNQEILKKSIESQLEEKANALIKKTQKVFKGEPFLWGSREIRNKFLTYDEYDKYNWMEKYPKAEVTAHFIVKLRSFGKLMDPPEKLKEEKN